MAGPIAGSIEHLMAAGLTTASCQSFFVNCYNFFNNNTGTLGIQRIAYHTGSTPPGGTPVRGMNFYDQANPAGDNAWACFRFLSASVPFDILIQASMGSAFGNAPGNPGLSNGSAATQLFGIAFACTPNSGTAWNGTQNNNGSDAKGAVVWTSSSQSSTIWFPRSNEALRAGSHGTLKQNMLGFAITNNYDYRAHFIADYDNIVILYDLGATNAYSFIMIGLVTPVSGLTMNVPYFSLCDSVLPTTDTIQIGSLAGTGAENGGIAYPNHSVSGTTSIAIDRFGGAFLQNAQGQPNKAFATPQWNEFPLNVGCFENPIIGLCGQNTFVREVYNIATHDTNAAGTRAVFGAATVASLKFTVPWHSGTVPGTGVAKEGTRFTYP